jgi:Ca2+-binding RTX toxin-like protein
MAFILGNLLDNVLLSSNDPTDTINGFAGIDTVSYALATSGVNVSLSITGPQNTGGSGIDTLIDIENITGSNFNDTLQGTAGNNIINGGHGNDFVSYSSATGSVTINLQGGLVTGAAGFDTLISIENAIGSNFSDTIFGNSFNNVIASGAGDDTILASLGSDVIDGGFGLDTVNYSKVTGPITLGAFGVVTKSPGVTDQLNSVEVIVATTSAQDTIDLSGATAPAALNTTVNLSGTFNNVKVNLSSGGAINLSALEFENVIGSGVADIVTGNSLANNISGNSGNDVISGGFGNDIIAGGAGNDTLSGGGDNDFFVFGEIGATNRDTITDFSALNDTILLKNSLDNGLVSSLAAGIKGLTFVGGFVAGNVLSATSFFKGVGLTGAGFFNTPGIYVDTTFGGAGNIFYNDSTASGSFVIASVGAAASSLTNADFVYAL